MSHSVKLKIQNFAKNNLNVGLVGVQIFLWKTHVRTESLLILLIWAWTRASFIGDEKLESLSAPTLKIYKDYRLMHNYQVCTCVISFHHINPAFGTGEGCDLSKVVKIQRTRNLYLFWILIRFILSMPWILILFYICYIYIIRKKNISLYILWC